MVKRKEKKDWKYWRLPFGSVTSWPLVDPDARDHYPALAARFDELEELGVADQFHENDEKALSAQRRYRRMQLGLIFGAGLTTFFGALQVVTENPRFSGVAIAVTGFGTSALARTQRSAGPLGEYLRRRMRAEKLRSLFFRYLCSPERPDPRSLEVDVASITYPPAGGRAR